MAEFDETFDWVVIGCGGGSMASGLLMKSQGKSVVILEKSKFAGGTTCKSGGVIWMPNNRFMDPGEDSLEKACQYLDAVVGVEHRDGLVVEVGERHGGGCLLLRPEDRDGGQRVAVAQHGACVVVQLRVRGFDRVFPDAGVG